MIRDAIHVRNRYTLGIRIDWVRFVLNRDTTCMYCMILITMHCTMKRGCFMASSVGKQSSAVSVRCELFVVVVDVKIQSGWPFLFCFSIMLSYNEILFFLLCYRRWYLIKNWTSLVISKEKLAKYMKDNWFDDGIGSLSNLPKKVKKKVSFSGPSSLCIQSVTKEVFDKMLHHIACLISERMQPFSRQRNSYSQNVLFFLFSTCVVFLLSVFLYKLLTFICFSMLIIFLLGKEMFTGLVNNVCFTFCYTLNVYSLLDMCLG